MEPSLEPSWVNDSETSGDFYCDNQLDCSAECAADCEETHICGYNGQVAKMQSGGGRHWTEYWTCPGCEAEYSEDCSTDDYYDA